MRGYSLKLAALVWFSLILFSSTSLAGTWSAAGFRWIASWFLGHLGEDQPSFATWNFAAEKCFHLLVFTVFAMLVWRMVPDISWKFVMVLAAGITMGIASELLQSRFPGRDPTLRDVFINTTGTALGAAISLKFGKRTSMHIPPPQTGS
jgi:VanZ family protein